MACLRTEETVANIINTLDTINHSGFPVVEECEAEEGVRQTQLIYNPI